MRGEEGRGEGGGEESYLDVVLVGVEELVDLCEPPLHVPEQHQTQRGRGTQHAKVLLVLVQPLVAVIRQQLVRAKAGVDKTIDERRSQVGSSRVH